MSETTETHAALEEAIKAHFAAMTNDDGSGHGILLDWVLTATVLPASDGPAVDFYGETSQNCMPHVQLGLTAYAYERAKVETFRDLP